MRLCLASIACLTVLLTQFGCEVPGRSGRGSQKRIVEPSTRRGYWLYLPQEYVQASEQQRRERRWPVVVSFHGMRPFDNAVWQINEWGEEADRYGLIVVSPEMRTSDMMAEFPLRTIHPGLKSDEVATLAILDQVFATTQADPSNVLATGWSSGGYLAHYMMNHHPDRFTCLVSRQGNFSWTVMSDKMAPRSHNHPILIINTENDIAVCRKESREAVTWYERHGYKNVAWVYIRRLGHQRTPDLAADFFGRIAGVTPNKSPEVLAHRQAIDGNAEGLAFLSGRMSHLHRPENASGNGSAAVVSRLDSQQQAGGSNDPSVPDAMRVTPSTANEPTLSIRVSSAIGIQPLHLGYSASCPSTWYDSAKFLWTLNNEPIGNTVNGQRTLTQAGEHTLGLLVVTPDNQEYRATRRIRVLPHIRPVGNAGNGTR
ncbi:MAG: prolyl oligopeptidase family serine peptidase [Phycisphaerae bacterium]|nr:prolyl oligopeptidase family serine peptidase [Phycisphaerae bacterium]